MRVAVLPRDEAARVTTSALARGVWAVNGVSLVLTIPLLLEFTITRGLSEAVPGPLSILFGMIGMTVIAGFFPKPWVVTAFLVLGAVGAVAFQVLLIAAYPAIVDEGYLLLNRPAVSLVLVAIGASTWLAGLVWTLLGFLVSTTVSVWVAFLTGLPFRTGWGPLLVLAVYTAAFLVLAGIQRSQRRLVPDFDQLEEETRRLGVEEGLRSRVTAAVHDTLLNDLSIVMNAPDELDDRARARLREDVATLTSAEWMQEAAQTAVIDDQDSALRNQIMQMMSDLQWRGLTVHVTGSGTGIYRLAPATATAIVDAIRACLENVLRHSGAVVAQVDLAYSADAITVIVSDQGSGFDAASIPSDRLGVRGSIVGRIEAVGGSVKIWSSPGEGTSVVMRIPFEEVVTEHEESQHGNS